MQTAFNLADAQVLPHVTFTGSGNFRLARPGWDEFADVGSVG